MKDKSLKAIAAEWFSASRAFRSLPDAAVRMILAVSLFLACILTASPAEAAPAIQLMTPQSGPVGTLVAIVGSGFGASQGTSTVTFNGTPVTWVSWSATSLQVQVPAGATSGNVVVSVSGKGSNTKSFTVTPSPAITGLSPTSGPVGATVTVTGSNFTAGGTQTPQVVFYPELFASPTSSTDTSITVAIPAGAATGDLLVAVGGGNSNSVLFTVTSSDPSINSLAPGGGVVGTAVTITGTNFGSSQGTSTVTFNGTTASPTSWSATQIKVPIPTGATTGNVLVTVGGVASNPYGFEVGTAAPIITSISPTSGAVATSVTIAGTGFGSTQGANTVNFNGVSGVPTSWSATQIKVPVPTGATTGSVVVAAGGTVSNGVNFTVPGTGPSVTRLSPSSGPVGTSVTIAGTNFDAMQGASTVTFNGIAATATSWSPTSIVATVPAGVTSGSVVVTVSGTASSGLNFTVAPSITSLSPTSGAVGTPVTIAGTNFGATEGASTVTFNGLAAIPTSWGASSITVPVPAGAATGNVVVTVSGVASSGVSFTVLPTPSIASLSPTSGAVGTSVTITGANFGATQGTSTVTFNGSLATPTSWSATNIAVTVPSGATTGNVVVTVSGVGSNGVNFNVEALASISLVPQNPMIPLGAAQQFVAIGTYSDGSSQDVSSIANWSSSAPSVVAVSTTGLATGVAQGQTTIQVAVGAITGSTTLTVGPSAFSMTGSLNTARSYATSTLLEDGTVLVAGGFSTSYSGPLASAELYEPGAGSFVAVGNLNVARAYHTATLLNNGTVLVVGGQQDSFGDGLASAEIYNPMTDTFSTTTGNPTTTRTYHTATLLNNGQVLIAGGFTGGNQNSAELYNLVTGTFASTGNLITARAMHTATLLNDGTILMVGGQNNDFSTVLASAEIYNPTTGTFAAAGNLNTARYGHTATLLNDGTVLIAGGFGSTYAPLSRAEIYNPATKTFSLTGSLANARGISVGNLLNSGLALISGGFGATGPMTSAELYDPKAGAFASAGSLNTGRYSPCATLLNNGSVLVSGGVGADGNALASAEIYLPTTLTPAGLNSISVSPASADIPVGQSQRLVATGTYSDGSTQTLSSVTWTPVYPTVATISNDVTNSGSVLGVGVGLTNVNGCAGSVCGSATITVSGPVLSLVTVTPANSFVLPVGSSLQLHATGTFSDGSVVDLTSLVSWSSSNPSVASINANGIAMGVLAGGTTITATSGTGTFAGSTNLTVLNPPNITSVSPSSAQAGSSVSILGSYFGASQGTGNVALNGLLAQVASWSDSTIVVTVPQGAVTGYFVVTTGAGLLSNGEPFGTLVPTITSLSPTSGFPGTAVTISGSNFGPNESAGIVTFNGVNAAVSSWSPNTIVSIVPLFATTGNVVVTAFGSASNGSTFTVIQQSSLSITGISPNIGAIGTPVTITGTSFGASQGSGSVTFSGFPATISSWSDTSILVPVPVGATTGPVAVSVNGSASNSVNFTVPAPALLISSPPTGTAVAPGQTVSVTLTSPANTSFSGLVVSGGASLGYATVSSSVPASLSLPVSDDTPFGMYNLSASGLALSGDSVSATPIQVDIERSDVPTGMTPTPSTLGFDAIGQSLAVEILGAFADGTSADVTLSSYMTYSSTDPTVATVDPTGVVSAVGPGSCFIMASYVNQAGPQTIGVPVTVSNPVLLVAPSSLSFAAQRVGTASAVQQITVTNNSSGPLNVLAVNSSGNFDQTNTCLAASPLDAGASCAIYVVFSPASVGAQQGSVVIKTDGESISTTVSLSGSGQ